MNHQEIKDLLPLYALGGLDDESAAAVERHLPEPCDECAAELRKWYEVVGLLPLGVTPAGSGAVVKRRLMARVRQELGATVVPLQPPPRWRPAWMAWPLAAAAVVLLVIGGLRYQKAVKSTAEQSARVQMVEALLAQEQETRASREAEMQRLTARLEEQQAAAAQKAQTIAQLEASLAEQRRLVALREQELARVQSASAQSKAASEREIAGLKAELARQRDAVASGEQELRALRATLEQQRALVEANTREVEQLRAALARQRGVIEVLTTPGLRVGYLQQAKPGVTSQGHVLWNERKATWLVYAFGLPQPPAGKEYQVWLITEKVGPVSAGLFTPDQTGTGLVVATPSAELLGAVTAAAVTLEPAGGLAKPSGEMYLRGSL